MKRNIRRLWITKINAATRLYDVQYSRFIQALNKCKIGLNRKSLATLAEYEPHSFKSVVDQCKTFGQAMTK